MSKKPYTLTKVDRLPVRARVTMYDDLVDEIKKQGLGTFEVNVEGKSPRTVYAALYKRVKGTNIKLHMIKEKLYAEVT